MDPVTNAVMAPWAQFGVVGAVVVALGAVVVMLWRSLNDAKSAHLAAVERCHAQTLDITVRQTDANNKLAHAMEGLERVVQAALDAMRK